jgi:hypothetical protein
MSTDTLERTDLEVIEGVDLSKEIECHSCGKRADWRLAMKCCGDSTFKCDPCYQAWLTSYEEHLIAVGGRATVHCGHCGHLAKRVRNLRDCFTEHRL